MSEEQKKDQASKRLDVNLGYHENSRVSTGDEVVLAGNVRCRPLRFKGRVKDPILTREALSALYQVVKSDFRYVPKDRSAYMAYQRMKKQSSSLESWKAQQAYFDWLARNDPMAWLVLDPVITVHPDQVFFEVFSKDEGSYARLALDKSGFDIDGKEKYGTTNIDFSSQLFDGLQKMRSYREYQLVLDSKEVKLENTDHKIIEKKIPLPFSWLRGFLQVQSAATLPGIDLEMKPIDFYNILRHLRLNADRKKAGRAMRFELVPGETPRLILEPWEKIFELPGIYKGKIPRVIKMWGRRRLMLLRRILPLAQSIELRLQGTGLPSFFTLKAPGMTFTLGITGFTARDWTKATAFDLLLPRQDEAPPELEKIVSHLKKKWHADFNQIAKATKIAETKILRALQTGCQRGILMYDLKEYRLRPLEIVPDEDGLKFRNNNERLAYDYLGQNLVKLASEKRAFDFGIELEGKIDIKAEKREYRSKILLAEDGRLRKAECSCAHFRSQGLKSGPCSHLIALCIFWHKKENENKDSKHIVVETRSYSKRNSSGEQIYQLSLEKRWLKKCWGMRDGNLRRQKLVFNSVAEAREAFFAQAEVLRQKVF